MRTQEERDQEWTDVREGIEDRRVKSNFEAGRVLFEAGWKLKRREHILGASAYVFHPATGQIVCFDMEENDPCTALAAIHAIQVYKDDEDCDSQ